jgi:hypothetical protein
MLVHPTGPGGTSGGPKQTGRIAPAERAETLKKRPARGPKPPGDNIEISGAARQLSGATRAGKSTAQELPPERMREILDRIASGFYEDADVRRELLGQIAAELGLPPSRS